jgi:hypothetical protein
MQIAGVSGGLRAYVVNWMEALKQSLSHGKKQPLSSGRRAAMARKHPKTPKHRRTA